MTPEGSRREAVSQIRRLVNSWAEAVRNKDSAGLVANFAPDVLVFDLINPLEYDGLDALRKRAGQWLSSFEGPIEYEVRNLEITAGDDVAFCHSLNRVGGTTVQQKKIDMWWRATVCFCKVNGTWTVAHEHSSVPFNMESMKASLDLQPE
ncbi:MAG TPA: nuclear transport factor 2 family protein [Bryobacteraceae bacterium]|jgi:uncharacterized protein (TIGR02246 family)